MSISRFLLHSSFPSRTACACAALLAFVLAIALAALPESALASPSGTTGSAVPSKVKVATVRSDKAGQIRVTAKKAKGAKKYEFACSTSKKFDKALNGAVVTSVAKKPSAILRGLPAGTYFVKARAIGKQGACGTWSATKKVRISADRTPDELRNRIAALQAELETANARAAQAESDADAAEKQRDTANALAAYYRADASSARSAAESARADAADARSEAQADRELASARASEAEDARQQLAEATAENERLSAELDQSQAKAERFKEMLEVAGITLTPAAITYEVDGGSLPPGAKTSLTYEDPDYVLPEPSKTGCAFEGWYTLASGGERVEKARWVDGSITVYAHWRDIDLYYAYVDKGRRSQKTMMYDEQEQRQVGVPIYELYIGPGSEQPAIASTFEGGNVVYTSHVPAPKSYVPGSVTLRARASYEQLSGLFASGFEECTSIDLSRVDMSQATSLARMFEGCSEVEELDLSNWDVSNVTDVFAMFSGCEALKRLDVSGWSTGNVSRMDYLFADCGSLEQLDLRGWDTRKVESMDYLFSGCTSLKGVDFEGWDARGVVSLRSMFKGCKSVESLDLTPLKANAAKDACEMFSGCASLQVLDISGWDLQRITNSASSSSSLRASLFEGCESLRTVVADNVKVAGFVDSLFRQLPALEEVQGMGKWQVKVTDASRLFAYCPKLKSVDLSGFDVSSATSMEDMLYNCPALTELKTGEGWTYASGMSDEKKPKLPCAMADGAGVALEEGETIPAGAHAYTATTSA